MNKKNILFISFIEIFYLIFSLFIIFDLNSSFFSSSLILDEKSYVQGAMLLLKDGLPDRPFYQAPLYPFLIAGMFSLFGFSLFFLKMLNVLFGLLTLFLLFRLALVLFDKKTALFSASLMIFSGLLYFTQGLILKISISLFFFTGFLYFVVLFFRCKKICFLVLSALFLSILSLLRENAVILIVPTLLCFFLIPVKLQKKLISAFLFLLVFSAILSPFAVFNSMKSGSLTITSSQAGHNFYIGNNPASYGRYTSVSGIESNPFYQEKTFTETAKEQTGTHQPGSYWIKKALQSIQEDKKRFLRLLMIKTWLFFNDYEIPNNRNFYFERSFFAPLLYLFPISFGILFPLSLVGCISSLKKRRLEEIFLISVFFVYAISVILFYVLSRYRILIWPIAILYAARGFIVLLQYMRNLQIKRLLLTLTLIAAVSLFSFHVIEVEGRLNPFPTFSREELHTKEFSYVLYNMGAVFFQNGEFSQARGILQTLIQVNPDYTYAYYMLARINAEMKNFDEMVQNYSIVLKRKKELLKPEDIMLLEKYNTAERDKDE